MFTPVLLGSADWGESYILEWVGLVLVGFVFWRYLRPPLARAMNAQRERIRASLEAGKEAALEAEKILEQERRALEDTKREAAALVEQAAHDAGLLLEQGRRHAEDEYARLVARADAQVALERARIEAEIGAELTDLVVRFASRVVEAELDPATQHRLFAEVIEAAEAEAS